MPLHSGVGVLLLPWSPLNPACLSFYLLISALFSFFLLYSSILSCQKYVLFISLSRYSTSLSLLYPTAGFLSSSAFLIFSILLIRFHSCMFQTLVLLWFIHYLMIYSAFYFVITDLQLIYFPFSFCCFFWLNVSVYSGSYYSFNSFI